MGEPVSMNAADASNFSEHFYEHREQRWEKSRANYSRRRAGRFLKPIFALWVMIGICIVEPVALLSDFAYAFRNRNR